MTINNSVALKTMQASLVTPEYTAPIWKSGKINRQSSIYTRWEQFFNEI